jgi:S1-C subfamily serine protease
MVRLLLPRKLLQIVRRPIYVDLEDGLTSARQRLAFEDSLRLGYGEHCELRLDGEAGPEVICNLERARGPFRIWTPTEPGERDERVEVLVDGHALTGATQDIGPGSRVEVFDRRNGRRYRLVVEPQPPWLLQPRNLAFVVLVLAMAGVLYGVYFYYSLEGAQTQLEVAEERLRDAESDVERARTSLQEVERRLTATQGEFASSIRELKLAQSVSERAIRTEFDLQLAALVERARAEFARMSERDVEARARLQADTRAEVAALMQELEDRMVGTYQEFKRVEERLIRSLAARLETMEPTGARFKRVLQDARGAALFIRTTVEVQFARAGEVVIQQSFGSGFFISEGGLALTARHVLFPWHYDRELQVLVSLGLVSIREDTVEWSIWTADQQVLAGEDASGAPRFNAHTAWSSRSEDRAVRHLYSPAIDFSEERVEAPVGAVTIPFPVSGPDDVAVMQFMQFAEPAVNLAIAAGQAEPLDEALAVGYPFSRLEDGVSAAQGVTGFVRRVTENLLELDTALSPGSSGGPVLNRDGDVIGMAIGVLESDVYGLAVPARYLRRVLEDAAARVRSEEARLEALGCNPGQVDGVFDGRTWEAYGCERARKTDTSAP